jgi:hypothetical protein
MALWDRKAEAGIVAVGTGPAPSEPEQQASSAAP